MATKLAGRHWRAWTAWCACMVLTVPIILFGWHALATGPDAADAARPEDGRLPRVASITLCGDEFLLRLADPAQIASLSLKADRPLARYPERTQGFARNNKDVEQLLSQGVEVVILESGGDSKFATALRRVGIRTVLLPSTKVDDIAGIAEGLRRVATAIGQAPRAEPIVADMERRAAALAADRPPPEQRPVVAYFRPEGGGAGAGTYINTTLELAGLRNMQALAGQTGWKRMAMENVVQTPPEAFVLSFFDTQQNSLGAIRARSPLLRRMDVPVIDIPGRYWICAGPSIVDAAERLHAARIAHFPHGSAIR